MTDDVTVTMERPGTKRMRAFRERQRAKKPPRKPPKTNQQRCREYRARQKALKSRAKLLQELEESHSNEEILDCMEFKWEDLIVDSTSNSTGTNAQNQADSPPYKEFKAHGAVHREFKKKFIDNPFGSVCSICDLLWFPSDVKIPDAKYEALLRIMNPEVKIYDVVACKPCLQSLIRNQIPNLAKYNGFKYPEIPKNLPPLDLISERLISPRIPFVQIRRLRHVNDQDGIYGQIINLPVSVNTMVHHLPRNIDDDHCINVHIENRKIHRSSCLIAVVKKWTIKSWLDYLITTPLYKIYNITMDEPFLTDNTVNTISINEISENTLIEDSLTAQQQTLLWNDEKCLRFAQSEVSIEQSILFHEHTEELSFPSIYLGQLRVFRQELRVTPLMMAVSELRRADRRGVTPYHLLYMAMKIMRLRVRDSLDIASKHTGEDVDINRQQIESEEYVNQCIENELAFLRCIPNSSWYWAEQKRDLFAMMRQLGKPTMFLKLSANEIEWIPLLQTLYKLKNKGTEISESEASELNYMQKSALVNEDAVTCTIYFNKLVNVLLSILQSKKSNPFGEYRVVHYFKRIEFQHTGSPCAHVLLWLRNAPTDPTGADRNKTVALINKLSTVLAKQSSRNIKLQTHKHTFFCYKNVAANGVQNCRFGAPFMPCRATTILTPLPRDHVEFSKHAVHYKDIRVKLENHYYRTIDDFFRKNQILSDEHYMNILRAGIKQSRVFLKRDPSEKWHIAFNPFILNILQSTTDIQFILDEYSCAQYIVEYINETNRGISNLQRQIIQIMDEHPEFDVIDVARKMSVDMLNTVEITSQEAAWYLLREPMSRSSSAIVYIPTVRPAERQKLKETLQELEKMECDDDSTDIGKEDYFVRYQKRPETLESITLAQFVSYYTRNYYNGYSKRKDPSIIRYQNYDKCKDLNEYKREMVTLHLPFRTEDTEILEDKKFIRLYDENEEIILQRRKEFEANSDLQKIIEICQRLCCENEFEEEGSETQDSTTTHVKPDPSYC